MMSQNQITSLVKGKSTSAMASIISEARKEWAQFHGVDPWSVEQRKARKQEAAQQPEEGPREEGRRGMTEHEAIDLLKAQL